MSDETQPSINLSVQWSEMSPELQQTLFILFVLLININVFFCILNAKLLVKNTYKLIQFIVNKSSYNGYNVLLDTENSV